MVEPGRATRKRDRSLPSVALSLGGNIRVVEAVSPLIAPGCGTNAARNDSTLPSS